MRSIKTQNNVVKLQLTTFFHKSLLTQTFRKQLLYNIFIRPPDIVCRRTYILPGFFFFLLSFFLFFRQLIFELAQRNSTISGHMVGSKCNLKMHVRNLGYPFPLQIRAQKPKIRRPVLMSVMLLW